MEAKNWMAETGNRQYEENEKAIRNHESGMVIGNYGSGNYEV